MTANVDDIVKFQGSQNSWRVSEINGEYYTCLECSDNGLESGITTITKEAIIEIIGNINNWK